MLKSEVSIPPVKLTIVGAEAERPLEPERLGEKRLEQFLDLKAIAPRTRDLYAWELQRFGDWVQKDLGAVMLNDVRRYKLYLEQEQGLKPSTVALALAALKSFYTWMVKAGYVSENPMMAVAVPQPPEPEGRNLERFEVETLFAALDGRGETEERDRAILCLLFCCGLRATEVSKLNVGDFNGVEVLIREAKHESIGRVPVNAQTDAALRAYLRQRWEASEGELEAADPLFVSYSNKTRGQRLGYQGIYYLVKTIAKAAGLENVHPHRGRHTFASRLIEDGMDAYLAMQLTRHRSVQAFKTYTHQVKYQVAKTAYLEGQGMQVGVAQSLAELVEVEELQEQQLAEVSGVEKELAAPVLRGAISKTPIAMTEVQIGLRLEVEDVLLSGRKKSKVRKLIEQQVLSRYQMVKPKPRGKEYLLTFSFVEEDELSQAISEILWDMEIIAELDNCAVQWEWLEPIL